MEQAQLQTLAGIVLDIVCEITAMHVNGPREKQITDWAASVSNVLGAQGLIGTARVESPPADDVDVQLGDKEPKPE